MAEAALGGTLNQRIVPPRPEGLRDTPLDELVGELLARIHEGVFGSDLTILLGCELQDALRQGLDVHCNRKSARHYRDMFYMFRELSQKTTVSLDGATVVDLGCGSQNPFGLIFLFLMVGAGRGIAIDLDEIQDFRQALQALADCAAMMLVDPTQLVHDYPVTRSEVLRNIASFDLAQLRLGESSGIDAERLSYRRESIFAMSLDDEEADLVMTNAFLEHLPDIDRAIAEMARITRRGGFHIHNIDGSDHRRYGNIHWHPLEFLTEYRDEPLVHGSNRIRLSEFIPLFERHGFEIIAFDPFEWAEIDGALRERLVEPYRTMPDEVLSVIGGRLFLRRS